MRAVVYHGPDEVRVREVPDPQVPGPDGALVRVTVAGICGTDLHVIHGDFPGVTPGMIVGHEFVGEVVAIGSRVRRLSLGDQVMASDFTACGRCRWCDRRQHWHCADRSFFGTGTSFGPAIPGAQTELVAVPHADTTLGRLPPGLSPDAAILLGDNLATAWSALERAGLEPGERLAVIGGGPVGQLIAACALAVGAGLVVMVEPTPGRRAIAEARGVLTVAPAEAASFVSSVTEGDGVDVVVEAVGALATMDSSLSLVRRAGRVVSVGAHAAPQWSLPISESFSRELNLSFVIGNSIKHRDRLVQMVMGGSIEPTFIIDGRVRLDQAVEAYAALKAQQYMKIIIDLG